MPWFCHKPSHKGSKTKIGSATPPSAANDKMCFAVVLQDFEASVSDELSIRRGVLVETLYRDGNWQYVRDVDGQCGYVPNSFCYNLDQIRPNQWNLKERSPLIPRPRPKSIQVSELPLATSSQSLGEHFSRNQPLDTTTPSQTESCQTTTLERLSGTVRRLTPAGEDHSGRSSGNGGSSEQASSASQVLNSVKDSPTSVHTAQTRTDSRAASCSSQLGNRIKREPRRRSLHRAFSYQEAVISADENLYGLTAGIKPSDLETAPANQQEETREGDHFDTLESFQSGVSHVSEYNMTDTDDVFLPENKKPLGIYRCQINYKPQFEGEILLQENELVIMLDKGRGEWAWVLTSTNVEGLVPKHILAKYHHHPRTRISTCAGSQTSIGTQTELIVTTPLVKQICSSPVSARGSRSSVRSPASKSSPHKRHRAREKVDLGMKHQTDTVAAAAAAQTDCLNTPWFDTADSRDRTPPELDSATPTRDTTDSTACVQSTPSLAQSAPPKLSSRSRLRLNLKSSPTQGHHNVVRAINFEPENDTMNTLSSRRKFRQTPVLSAVKNYDPPVNAKNCLSLTKGDILYTQPHMHYPKGWMWVWHSTQKTFGYVPKDSVAFMYLVQKKNRRQLDSTEDAV